MKELDTVFPDFEVELLDCPKKNAFPSRKGKPEMFRFPGAYVLAKDYEIKVDQDGKMNIFVNSKSSLELYKNIQSHFGGTEYLGYYKNRTFFSFLAGSRGKLQQQSLIKL